MSFLQKLFPEALQPRLQLHGPIGFDLALEKLNLVQMEKTSSVLKIHAAASVPYPCSREELLNSPDIFKKFVHEALATAPFKGKTIISCLVAEKTKIINLTYDKEEGDETSIYVKAVLNRFGGAAEDYVIDYLPIRIEDKKAKERKALIASCRRDDVLSYLGLLNASGMKISALEVGPAALRRLVTSLDRENKYPTVLLINFGRASSFLTVFSGRRLITDAHLDFGEEKLINHLTKALMMDREVQFGEQKLITRLSAAFSIAEHHALKLLYEFGFGKKPQDEPEPEDEIVLTITEILKPLFMELAEEVSKVLIYTAAETRGGKIERIYILGSVARYPGSDFLMTDMFSIPVEVLNPLAQFARDEEGCGFNAGRMPLAELGPAAGLALATGMSLRGLI